MNILGLSIGNDYDLIISADCIEHVLLTDKFLNNIKACCHSETRVVISTPDSSTTKFQRNDHKHFWTKEDFVKVLEANGFEMLNVMSKEEIASKPSYTSTIVVCKLR
jgi:2-polyprenyl-3-methyl-5-hydroxy-6-metoxy-1,4-benzoquinol methylase